MVLYPVGVMRCTICGKVFFFFFFNTPYDLLREEVGVDSMQPVDN